MHQLGFSDESIATARASGQGLNPEVKVYNVLGDTVGHTAMSASLGGEEIWWSHGGDLSWYGKNHLGAEGKVVANTEEEFKAHYRAEGDVVLTHTLNLTMGQTTAVIQQMNARIAQPTRGSVAFADPRYSYNEYTYNCVQSVVDILMSARIPTAFLATPAILVSPYQAEPLFMLLTTLP